MNKEKGQIQIVIILIIIVGIILFGNVPKLFEETFKTGSPSSPVFQEESVISSTKEGEETLVSPDTALDTYAPYRFNGQPTGDLPAITRKTLISLKTNEQAVCRYNTVSGAGYYSMNRIFSNSDSIFHSTQVTGLSEGQKYVYYIKCVDKQDNVNTDDFIISFTVKEPDDFTQPGRRNQYPAGDALHYDTRETVIGISTDEPAFCRYDTEQGTSYNSMRRSLADDGTKQYHTARITGLEPGQSYSFFVRCKDIAGNVNTGDVMIYFSVGE